jgi:hypothetical protein
VSSFQVAAHKPNLAFDNMFQHEVSVPCEPATQWDESRADVQAELSTAARRQVRTVRKRQTEGNATAAQSAFGWEAVHRTALDAVAVQWAARVGIGTRYNGRDAG